MQRQLARHEFVWWRTFAKMVLEFYRGSFGRLLLIAWSCFLLDRYGTQKEGAMVNCVIDHFNIS